MAVTPRSCKAAHDRTFTSADKAISTIHYMLGHGLTGASWWGFFLCGVCNRWHIMPMPRRVENAKEVKLQLDQPDDDVRWRNA